MERCNLKKQTNKEITNKKMKGGNKKTTLK